MKFTTSLKWLYILTIFLLAGCATSRGIVSIDIGKAPIEVESIGKQVYIQSVIDQRVFQENPKTQDIPSLGFEGAEKARAEIKKKAIGRKRNSFGKALGDILLEENQNVETVINDALVKSYREKGYQVLEKEIEVNDETIIVNTTIKKFWAYMTPGFWAITLSSDISCIINTKSPSGQEAVSQEINVHSEGNFQTGGTRNWMEVIHKSLQEFITKVKETI